MCGITCTVPPEVVAAALLADHALVDLAGREVVALAHLDVGEALVVAEVEVGLGAVLGDEHLAVLERAHRAGIDVDVRVELEIGDADAAGGEDRGQRRGGDALPQRGNDAAGHEHELGHGRQVPEITILPEPVAAHKRSRAYPASPRCKPVDRVLRVRRSASTASIGGVCGVAGDESPCRHHQLRGFQAALAATDLIAAPIASRLHSTLSSAASEFGQARNGSGSVITLGELGRDVYRVRRVCVEVVRGIGHFRQGGNAVAEQLGDARRRRAGRDVEARHVRVAG